MKSIFPEKNKKIVGLDLDGVIIDHTAAKIDLAAQLGWKLKPAQTHPEVLRTIIPTEPRHWLQQCLYHDPKIAMNSPLMPGAKAALVKIKKTGTAHFLISRRKDPEIAVKLLQLRGLWPMYFNKRNSFFVAEAEDKNAKALECGVTHFVDDEAAILEKLTEVKNRFLFDRFGIFKDGDNWLAVKSWPELLGYLL